MGGAAGVRVPGADRHGVRVAGLRVHHAADARPRASACCSGSGVFPLFLFSGAFFPIDNLGEVGAWVARLTPLWHGVNLSRMFFLDNVDWGWAAVNAGVLLALTVLGVRWSIAGLTKRLVS